MSKDNENNKMSISSKFEELSRVREYVINNAKKYGFDEEEAYKIALAVDEACTNIIKYSNKLDASKPIQLSIETTNEQFIINIEDSGPPFNPLDFPSPNMKDYLQTYKRGGLGIYIMRSLIDEIDYIPANENKKVNTLKLKKKLKVYQ